MPTPRYSTANVVTKVNDRVWKIAKLKCDAEAQTQVTKVPNYKNKTRIPISFRNKREYHR